MKINLTKMELWYLMSFLENLQLDIDCNYFENQPEIVRSAIRDFITKNTPRMLSLKDSFKIKLSLTEISMLDYCIQYLPENNSAEIIEFKSRMVSQLNQYMLVVRSTIDSPLNFFA